MHFLRLWSFGGQFPIDFYTRWHTCGNSCDAYCADAELLGEHFLRVFLCYCIHGVASSVICVCGRGNLGANLLCMFAWFAHMGQHFRCIFCLRAVLGVKTSVHFICVCTHVATAPMHFLWVRSYWGQIFHGFLMLVQPRTQQLLCILCLR